MIDRSLAPELIDCIDCGGVCHLISHLDEEDPPRPGDVLVYRCADCLDRWDVVIPDLPDLDEG